MHISANMYSFIKSYGHPDLLDESLVMEKMYNIGYRHVDINFTELTNKNFILRDDGWRQRVEKVGETAARLGMRIHQSHLPFADQASPDFYAGGYAEYFDICMHRAYQASALLGVEWGVIHPRTYPEFNNEDKACLAANHAYYDQFVELGVGLGVGTAMENQLPYLKRQRACRYCQHYDQLIELVDSFREPLVGICWDTGHANQMQFNQARALRAIGGRLKALHINDNHYGTRDEHLIPFLGEIDWYQVMQALAEIGYTGVLTYETGQVGRKAPAGLLQDALANATFVSAQVLVGIYEQALKDIKGDAALRRPKGIADAAKQAD